MRTNVLLKTLPKACCTAQANCIFGLSLFAVRGIRCCRMDALSNFPSLKELDMLALWGWLRSRFCSSFRNGFGLPILWHN